MVREPGRAHSCPHGDAWAPPAPTQSSGLTPRWICAWRAASPAGGGCSMWQSRSLRTPSPGVPTCALLSFPWQQAPGWSIPRSALAGGREPGHCSLPPEPWVLATRGWVLLHFCCTCSSSCLKQHQCPAGAVTAEPASAASLLLHLFNLTWGFSTAFLPGKKKKSFRKCISV